MSSLASGNAPPDLIDCETAVRRLWDYIDGRLAEMARAEVETHLATCQRCPPHFAFAQRMRVALAAAGATVALPADEAGLRERVRGALRQLDGISGDAGEER
jgi:anti-sigma factor (TIGR02949 family)